MRYQAENNKGNFTFYDIETGKQWHDYFWNSLGYVCEMTHTGLMTSHRLDENSENIRLNIEKQSCVYLRDDDSGVIWNIGEAPVCTPVSEYTCTFGQEFARISSVMDGIFAELTVGVCPNDTAEVWRVRVENRSGRERHISVVPCVPFDQEGFNNHGLYFSGTTAETYILPDIHTVVSHSTHPHKPHPRCDAYISAYTPAQAYQGRLEKFYGTAGSSACPLELRREKLLSCENAGVRPKCGAIQNCLTLAAGGSETLTYRLGFADNMEELKRDYEKQKAESLHLFDDAEQRGVERYGKLRAETPSEPVNRLMNFWAEKQVDFCMIGKKAVRDNAQLALAMLNYDTELAKKTLSECFCHQFRSGKALLNWIYWQPETYSDPSMWLILAACEYIKETGDLAYLDCALPYQDGGEGTVSEHLRAAVNWYMAPENIGPHGLPKIHYADWNDALNIDDPDAESVFMAMGLCWALREFAELERRIGDKALAEDALRFCERISAATNEHAWNGRHYLRALSKYGTVGDSAPVYINPQSWAILGDVVPSDRLSTLLDSIDRYETPEGIRLCSPAYETYDPAVGRMSGMRPGAYENGGIYNHACGFKVMADCKLGRAENALRTLLAMIPDSSEHNPTELTTTEPFVFTNCYLQNRTENMMVGFSWQTGSSAWGLRSFYEGILGLTRTYDGLKVTPCLPKEWDAVSVRRIYRGSELELIYHNRGGKTVHLTVDETPISGDLIRPFADGKQHRVEIELTE